MKLKILTLNVWRYYEWEGRKDQLIQFIKKENPDVICLQEVNDDLKFNEGLKNQAELIAKLSGYKYWTYGKTDKLLKWNSEVLDREVWMGDGIISKYPIIKETKHILKKYLEYGDSKDLGFVHAKIDLGKDKIDVLSVHYANNDKSSKLHLKETLEWCETEGLRPIIAGDFNMMITEDVKEVAGEDYYISYFIKPYKSFNPTNYSHNKVPVNLDYIITHKKKFIINKVSCEDVKISDHKPLIAEIEMI